MGQETERRITEAKRKGQIARGEICDGCGSGSVIIKSMWPDTAGASFSAYCAKCGKYAGGEVPEHWRYRGDETFPRSGLR